MLPKYLLPIAVCFLIQFVSAEGLQAVNGRIKITVGTTAGCSDTVRFVADLDEAYSLYRDFLDIEFIPWGRTTRNANGTLTCQFGFEDCWANRLHRCALDLLDGNLEAQMRYINCEFTTPYPAFLQGSYQCADAVGLRLVDIDNCVIRANDELDFEAERRGTEMTQAINFVPAIVFNNVIDLELHRQSLTQLTTMICFTLADDPSTGVTSCAL